MKDTPVMQGTHGTIGTDRSSIPECKLLPPTWTVPDMKLTDLTLDTSVGGGEIVDLSQDEE